MQQKQLREAMTILTRAVPTWDVPVVSLIAQESHDPYRVLISTLLSLRTLDQTTGPAAQRLFALADTPEAMLSLDQQTIERAIYPVGFYRNKAAQILEISRRLLDEFGGRVPDDIDVLTTFHGVGSKTANLVLAEGYGIPAICVDTHVHRISNRWGYVQTKNPLRHRNGPTQKTPAGVLDRLQSNAGGARAIISVSPRLPMCSACPVAHFANALACSARAKCGSNRQ